ncbi:MAG TPA: MFS transporter [Ramlibacter sp.]|nr:MFS transporter [Ramlibacter sp.]
MTPARRNLAFLLVVLASLVGFAGTDLVLPAIPTLATALGATAAQGQHVLASFTLGFAAGLLLFGELGARFSQRALLAGSLVLFSLASFAAGAAESIGALIALRLVQGLTAAAGAAFAPGIIRTVFRPDRALRAIGLQGSIESLVPALAPMVGAWILSLSSWRGSFVVLGVLALAVGVAMLALPRDAFPPPGSAAGGSYLRLLANREVQRHGWGQALSLGGLLVFVFGAPAVLVGVWGGTLADFIRMQVLGVACFIAAVQFSGPACRRYGEETVVRAGSALSAAGCVGLLLYALMDGRSPLVVALWSVPINLGFGLRGPPGFLRAIVGAGGDDSRAAALVVLAILLTAAGGTLLVAPWIHLGLVPLALVAALLSCGSLAVLLVRRHGDCRAGAWQAPP